jgi:mono/diheme cytochrome c family protein
MTHTRLPLAVLVLAWLAPLAGCGGPSPSAEARAEPALAPPAVKYPPRTDLLAIAIPEGAPPRWPTPGYPPTRSARLFPNTPDRDLAAELRKQFGKNVLDPTDTAVLSPAQADRINRLAGAFFGTPAAPTVALPAWERVVAAATTRLEPDKTFGAELKTAAELLKAFKRDTWKADYDAAAAARDALQLDDAALARGAIVYRRWCMQCHGESGAGDAAHATESGPAPRDYRQGVFKFVSAFPPPNLPKKGLGAVGKARRADLARTIRVGIDGTIMPAFPQLTEQEVGDAVSYVIHLAVRGETEFGTLAKIANVGKLTENDPDFNGGELDWLFVQNFVWVLYNWGAAERHAIPVPPNPVKSESERLAAAVRGFKLYNSAEFGCASCHAGYGRVQQLKWDAWGTVVQPRNLTLGVYRGGRRGEDLYARLYGGIGPSGMTAFHDRVTGAPAGQPNKLWDIVHFLQALPDPTDRRKMQALDAEVKFDQ